MCRSCSYCSSVITSIGKKRATQPEGVYYKPCRRLGFCPRHHAHVYSYRSISFSISGTRVVSALQTIAALLLRIHSPGSNLLPGRDVDCRPSFIGAAGKSSQIPLYVWRLDAMAATTPVSALIHAPTLVPAGVYMIVRCSAIYHMRRLPCHRGNHRRSDRNLCGDYWTRAKRHQESSSLINNFAAWLHVSPCGVGAFTAAIFHVITHAFSRPCSSSAPARYIHGMHHERDCGEGGLRSTCPSRLPPCLPVAGDFRIPIFAGSFPMDEDCGRRGARGL